MKKLFFTLSVTFPVLFVINIVWIVVAYYMWIIEGVQSIVEGTSLFEDIYLSNYLKWILLSDADSGGNANGS